jgi:hypothetical protein
MAILAVFIPVLMLGMVLALGRYEELLLPDDQDLAGPDPAHAPLPSSATSRVTSRGAAETPAPSP